MSFQGSHGDGAPANTRTPLVAWGAGVATPLWTSPDEVRSSTTRSSDQVRSPFFEMDLPTHSQDQIVAQLKAQTAEESAALR